MTRDEIKAYIESKGLDANIKIEGNQKTWKVTIKTIFEIPDIGVTEKMVGACLYRALVRADRQFWGVIPTI